MCSSSLDEETFSQQGNLHLLLFIPPFKSSSAINCKDTVKIHCKLLLVFPRLSVVAASFSKHCRIWVHLLVVEDKKILSTLVFPGQKLIYTYKSQFLLSSLHKTVWQLRRFCLQLPPEFLGSLGCGLCQLTLPEGSRCCGCTRPALPLHLDLWPPRMQDEARVPPQMGRSPP